MREDGADVGDVRLCEVVVLEEGDDVAQAGEDDEVTVKCWGEGEGKKV